MTTCLILLAGFALVVLGAVLLALAKPAIGLPEPKRVIHTAHRDRQPPGIVGLALFTALETLEITRAALRDRELRPHGIKLQAFLSELEYHTDGLAVVEILEAQLPVLEDFAKKHRLTCLTDELRRIRIEVQVAIRQPRADESRSNGADQ